MKLFPFLTLAALLTISSCSHFSGGKSCCAKKDHCSKEAKSCKKGMSKKECKEHCEKKKMDKKECKEHCDKKKAEAK
jgi:hypothetical protein